MYVEAGKKSKISKEDQDKLENMERICLNWGCNVTYKQIENEPKACRFHPGKWDFGHTGSSLKDLNSTNLASMPTPLWKPHWTCCRKDWNKPGCRRYFHRGPIKSTFDINTRKYHWPDERAQIYFAKNISQTWNKKLQDSCMFDKEKVEKIYHLLAKLYGGDSIPMDKFSNLMEKLKLLMMVSSSDLSFQFKYRDLIEGRVFTILDDGSGNVDKVKFMKWWFGTTEEIINDRAKAEAQ